LVGHDEPAGATLMRVDMNPQSRVTWQGDGNLKSLRLTRAMARELRSGTRVIFELPPASDPPTSVVAFSLKGLGQVLTKMAPMCQKVPWLAGK
jgi:invasion protein IalB